MGSCCKSKYSNDKKAMSRNKITVIILAVLACLIWTYIATRLLGTDFKAETSTDNGLMENEVTLYDLESLAMTPFKMPEVSKNPDKQKTRQSVPHKKTVQKHSGRYIGSIYASDVSLIVVEIDGIYRYVKSSDFTGDCRLLRKFDNDSVIVAFSDDTLTLYKNERSQ